MVEKGTRVDAHVGNGDARVRDRAYVMVRVPATVIAPVPANSIFASPGVTTPSFVHFVPSVSGFSAVQVMPATLTLTPDVGQAGRPPAHFHVRVRLPFE